MKTQPVSHISHLDLENVAARADIFQRHAFQGLPPPKPETTGHISQRHL